LAFLLARREAVINDGKGTKLAAIDQELDLLAPRLERHGRPHGPAS